MKSNMSIVITVKCLNVMKMYCFGRFGTCFLPLLDINPSFTFLENYPSLPLG
jgi:hypothetical protein